MKKEENIDGLWDLYFDGARNKNGSGEGVMLISPSLEKYYFLYKLLFSCTNNVVEYEALIEGLLFAEKKGIKSLRVLGDRKLVVDQIRGLN